MNTTVCPDGHASQSDDWCDVCGLAMSGAPSATAGGSPDPAAEATLPPPEAGPVAEGEVGRCPNCGTPRREGDAFCEVCGLDYATGALPEAPRSPLRPAPAVAAPGVRAGEQPPTPADPATPAEPTGAGGAWSVEVGVDPEWFASQEAEGGGLALPSGRDPMVVELTGAMVAVGRRSASEGWYPGIDLGHVHDDPGVSRRHGELVRADSDEPAAGWAWVDTGSTNGSVVDGQPVPSDVQHDLRDGSVVHLGAWTRLVLRAPAGLEQPAVEQPAVEP